MRRDEVIRPDGKLGSHCLVTVKSGVSVLAVDDVQNVFLAEEFHYAIGRTNIEVVSGGRDGDEEPLVAAKRELEEELGITAERWTDLGTVDPFTSLVVSPTQIFLAQGLTHGETSREGTESIRTTRRTLAEAVQMVMNSEITHGPSCVLILKAASTLGV